MEAVAMSDEQLAASARRCLDSAKPFIRELTRRGYRVFAEAENTALAIETPDGQLTPVGNNVQIDLRITREIFI